MFHRWAETKLYRRAMKVAVRELRRAARATNVLEKLEALEVVEQRLKDAQWLSREDGGDRFSAGLAEVQHSREQTLHQAAEVVTRLFEGAGSEAGDKEGVLAAAAAILVFLNHYQADDPVVEALTGRLLDLGGKPRSYHRITPLSEVYQPPAAGAGCALFLLFLLVGAAVAWLLR